MWQTKNALAIRKNLRVGVNFWPCGEGYLLSERPYSVFAPHLQLELLTYFGRVNKYLLHIVSKGRTRLKVSTLSFIIFDCIMYSYEA